MFYFWHVYYLGTTSTNEFLKTLSTLFIISLQELIKINQIEINVLNGDLSDLRDGDQFKDPTHFYSYDIDLFGKGSFFQYLNFKK